MRLPRKRELLAELLYRLGVAHAVGLVRRLLGIGPPIYLMGHRVLPESARTRDAVDEMALLSSHAITPQSLERRLRFLTRWVMPAGDPADLRGGLSSKRNFYLTFDDGYRDNVEVAAPVLDALGIRAVIFFVPELLMQPKATPWWDRWGAEAIAQHPGDAGRAIERYGDRCKEFKRAYRGLQPGDLQHGPQRYLSSEELAALPATFYVGDHTRAHANLTLLDDADLAQHIGGAGPVQLDAHPRYLPLLAYPFGFYNEAVLRHVRSLSKYSLAFATGNGCEGDSTCQRRINLNIPSFSLFALQCAGVLR